MKMTTRPQSPELASGIVRGSLVRFRSSGCVLGGDPVLGGPMDFLAWEPHFDGHEELPGRPGIWYGWIVVPRRIDIGRSGVVPIIPRVYESPKAFLLASTYVDVASPDVNGILTYLPNFLEMLVEDVKTHLLDLLANKEDAPSLTPAQIGARRAYVGMAHAIGKKTIHGEYP